MKNAIDAVNVTKVYRKYARKKQFATLKSALLSGSLVSELQPDETFEALRGVSFTHGSERLTAGSKKSLTAAAKIIKAMPAGVIVEIEGFTDNKGDAKLNQRLSQRRANEVKKFLVSKGVPAKRLSAEGLGEKKPKASNTTAKGRAANRRIEFVVKES